MPIASVCPLYVAKVERKGRTQAELDQAIEWLTGFDGPTLARHLEAGTTFADFLADSTMNPSASLITGVICGVREEEIEDPLPGKAGGRGRARQGDGEGAAGLGVVEPDASVALLVDPTESPCRNITSLVAVSTCATGDEPAP